ncbi:CaiB/BaiF CoA transferase family protein [Pararhizobium haloflavum]|uniref:CaiB/BaiF CoA transferase family protein n=1 Tax=Pararhizobium haloflavum TaxID=2037914 RepID=UPI000C1A897D|nr:CaiB/BaiF CoA-transferase family protein [Pararhizobium haloflavum]
MPGPLDGLLVVALEQAVAAPYASCRLADAGARVVKLERSAGDFARGYDAYANGSSSYFVWLNRGKESCTVDLKAPGDLALVRAMLAKADVFIQNLAPGATDRLGIGSAELRRSFPKLITCDISGYGADGPMKTRKAYDLLVQAESGLATITGTEHGAARVGVSVCDIATGMHAYEAILEALIQRGKTGRGTGVHVSLFHSMMDWMNVPWIAHEYGGKTPKRVGLAHPSIAPYGVFECSDGAAFLISIQNEPEWNKLCTDVLERPELPADPRFATNNNRVANRQATDAAVQAALGKMDRDTVARRLDAAGIAFGRLSELADIAEHPQARFVEVETPGGPLRIFGRAAEFSDGDRRAGPVPEIGSHDASLRAEFGRKPATTGIN